MQAIECLEGMFSQCYVLVDYAEWLIAHQFPLQQARDALHAASDCLLRIRGSVDDDDGVNGGSPSVASSQRKPGQFGTSSKYRATATSPVGSAGRAASSRQSGPTRTSGASVQRKGTSRATSTVAGGVGSLGSDWPANFDAGHIDLLVSARQRCNQLLF